MHKYGKFAILILVCFSLVYFNSLILKKETWNMEPC